MPNSLPLLVSLTALLITEPVFAQWAQWGRGPRHDNNSSAAGRSLDLIENEIVLDPFADQEEANAGGNLLVHYQAPLVDGSDAFVVIKSGTYTGPTTRETQTWSVHNLRRTGGHLVTRWTYTTDWKPVPWGSPGPSWEPVYHTAITGEAVWAPAFGGSIDKISREDGKLITRFNPFGEVNPSVFTAGPPVLDDSGNVYYTAIQLNSQSPWSTDPPNSWLVKVGSNGNVTRATFQSLTPGAPLASALCATQFTSALPLPHPPSRDAVAPESRCGAQRPGINVAPAVGSDGTIYMISRAHLNDRWGYLVAVNPNLTPKWAASLRNRFSDGCNVSIPPNGSPGGCRIDAITGVDPSDNQPGSGRVLDNSSSSPTITPDGKILYGAYTRYNYAQGHLMMFNPNGGYVGAYGFGWDLTPAIYQHDGTYSIVIKENRYGVGSYCFDNTQCPRDRTSVTPNDPEAYFITQLSSSLAVEWKHQNKETKSCARGDNGVVQCSEDHPNGFEWCVNAIAVDRRGVVYANSEDGHLYAINQGGTLRQRIFLRLALGAAYTPLSIGDDGRIYTQNDGYLFVVTNRARRRAVR
ncbi:MAG TPA: hypothetical protein VNM92_12195 [Thermoanaerobaculia bacterium]|nr:hypothetical protein [Thermoanaerobaculia bacterium]